MLAESFSSEQYPACVIVSSVSLYPRKKIIRGALTNGRCWIFLLMKFNDNFDGASYQQSRLMEYATAKSFDDGIVVSRPWPDLIVAILSHWVSLMIRCIME